MEKDRALKALEPERFKHLPAELAHRCPMLVQSGRREPNGPWDARSDTSESGGGLFAQRFEYGLHQTVRYAGRVEPLRPRRGSLLAHARGDLVDDSFSLREASGVRRQGRIGRERRKIQ